MADFFTYFSCVPDVATHETIAWIDTNGWHKHARQHGDGEVCNEHS